jgi:hypothetical protein
MLTVGSSNGGRLAKFLDFGTSPLRRLLGMLQIKAPKCEVKPRSVKPQFVKSCRPSDLERRNVDRPLMDDVS